MPKNATVFDIMISCPDDVLSFVKNIERAVDKFNNSYGKENNVVLRTISWKKNSYPQFGGHPQLMLNKQLVDKADIAVAVFWCKFGTETSTYGSGTEEEIEEMIKDGKQVFLYFLDKRVTPSKLDKEQYDKIQEFKERHKHDCYYFTAPDEKKLEDVLSEHLSAYFIDSTTKNSPQNEKKVQNIDTNLDILNNHNIIIDELQHKINNVFKPELLKNQQIDDFYSTILDKMNFKNRQSAEFFSWLSAVRALPFLGLDKEFTYWNNQERQRHLFAVFRAIDFTTMYLESPNRNADVCDIGYKAIRDANAATNIFVNKNLNAVRFAIQAAAFTVRNSTLFAKAAQSFYADVATAFICCAKDDSYQMENFKNIVLDDINIITTGNIGMFNNDTSVYGNIWDDFLENLRAIGCEYWANLYENLFKNRFVIDRKELDRRFNVPDEHKDQGAATVGKYLLRLGEDTKRLNEARIIILGEKGAGKTSIARRLIDVDAEMPKEGESTEGVIRYIWTFTDNDSNDMNTHIWDFAGHSITHSAHRCFMSARCVYIYVYNGRIERDNDPVYWLEQIRIYGDNPPIFFLINEKDNNRADIAERTLKKDYPFIVGYYRVDIANEDKTALEKFRKDVMNIVRNNPSWNNQLISSETYKVKNDLRIFFNNTKVPHITLEKFDEIATKNGASSERVTGILEDLHTLGICLWYNNEEMEDFNTLVLNPDWITNGIYKIINGGFNSNRHILTVKDGVEILKSDERYKYPRDKVAYLFRLMKIYELAFFKAHNQIFIPIILPKDEPDELPVFDIPSERLTMSFIVDKSLPPNITSRVIVHRSEFNEIYDEKLLWRTGAALKSSKHNAIALIDENGRSITVCVSGSGKTKYLGELRETLHNVFDSYKAINPKLWYEVLLPETLQTDVIRKFNEKDKPIMLLEEDIKVHTQKNQSYFCPAIGKHIPLDTTTKQYAIEVPKDIYFLFVTANENEKIAFEKKFIFLGVKYIKGSPCALGEFGRYYSAWFHMPSQGTSNADATLLFGEIIKDISPVAVIMVGIAFGADECTQKIGDVLISKTILNYDSRQERQGITHYTESPKEVGFQLYNGFRALSHGFQKWEYPLGASEHEMYKVFDGSILTGSALIDDYAFRTKLLSDFSVHKPIGGEMEAYGIYSQCRLCGVSEWIIVKAICDWGHNKQNSKKEAWQKIAADSAVHFCHSIFSLRGDDGKGVFDDLVYSK
ncbi:MAG: hypothetical protein FWG98_08285 [Candidatus Cloacimonetes bacterium]|nr:hypothetical protein [Candidatus Cloacimonadota bacterium]